MLSDVVNIFNSHMTLYLNIMKAQGFYILLRLFPFSQNRQGILTTRLFFHETKDKCPGLNCLPPKRFTVAYPLMKRNKDILISLINFQCADTDTQPHPQMLTQKAQWVIMSICLQIDITQKQIQSWRREKNR